MTEQELRAANLERVRLAFEGVSASDADLMLANYTEDMVLELPYADPPTVLEGRETVRSYLVAAFAVFQFRLWITQVYETVDPEMVVLEYESSGRAATTGKPYANTYIGVYWFRGGLISRAKEWYNPIMGVRAATPG